MITKVKTKKKMKSTSGLTARDKLLAKAKQAMDESKKRSEGGGGGGQFLYLDSDTKTTIRVFPTWMDDPEELFYQEITKHFGLGPSGGDVITCPGEECPICAHIEREKARLKKKMGKEAFKSKAWKALNRIGPKTKNLLNVVVLTRVKSKKNPGKFVTKVEDNNGSPMIYEAPTTVIQAILGYFLDDTGEWGVFYDKDTRYDFTIEKSGEGLDTKYVVTPTKLSAKFSTDQYLDKLHDLTAAAAPTVSIEEAEKLLRGEALEKQSDDEEDEAPRKSKFSKTKIKVKMKNARATEEEEDETPRKKIKKKVKRSDIEDELMSATKGVKTKKKLR